MSFQQQRARLGDLVSDLAYYGQAIAATGSPGGLQQWLANQYAAFNQLPAEVRTLSGQIARMRQVLAKHNPDAAAPLDDAQADLSAITMAYPAVAQEIQALLAQIAPTLSMGGDLSVLDKVAVGINGIGALHKVNELLSKRDDARDRIQSVANSPLLDAASRARVTQAMTGGLAASNLVKVGLVVAGVVAAVKLLGRGR